MAETGTTSADQSKHFLDEQTAGRFRGYQPKVKLESQGWQAMSIPENVQLDTDVPSRIGLTNKRYATVGINIYPPGAKDDMHCHPGSEHIFLVMEGELRIYGVKDGEDVVLKPGEFVHINQSYFYQLANETNQPTVICGVFTKPPKKPKLTRYTYRGENGVDPATLEGE
jgi:quercetin dioxygenase-like cupin family protein